MDNDEKQLAKLIYHAILTIMKNTLNLEEFSYRETGRDDPRYKTFKRHLMDFTYTNARKVLEDLSEWGLVGKVDYEEDVKHGYKETPSGGSGYVNSTKLSKIIKK